MINLGTVNLKSSRISCRCIRLRLHLERCKQIDIEIPHKYIVYVLLKSSSLSFSNYAIHHLSVNKKMKKEAAQFHQARREGAGEGQKPRGPATFRGPGWAQQSTYEKYYNQLYKVYDLCLLKYNITDT